MNNFPLTARLLDLFYLQDEAATAKNKCQFNKMNKLLEKANKVEMSVLAEDSIRYGLIGIPMYDS